MNHSLKSLTGNIDSKDKITVSQYELLKHYTLLHVFLATGNYEDTIKIDIENFLYITAYNDRGYTTKYTLFRMYKTIQYPNKKLNIKHNQQSDQVGAVAYPDYAGSRSGKNVKLLSGAPNHFHMVVFCKSRKQRKVLESKLESYKHRFNSLHYTPGNKDKGSIFDLCKYSLKAFVHDNFGETNNYEPIILPYANFNSKKNRQALIIQTAEQRRLNCSVHGELYQLSLVR